MPILTTQQYADSRRERGLPGGTKKAVRDAIASGRIKQVAASPVRVDSDDADRQWKAKTAPSRTDGKMGRRKVAAPVPPVEANLVQSMSAPPPPRQPIVDEDFDEARTRKAIADADLAEIKRDVEAGRVVEVADVRRAWSVYARSMRDGLLAIADRIADELGGLDSADDCRALVDAEIRRTLTKLSDDPPDHRGI